MRKSISPSRFFAESLSREALKLSNGLTIGEKTLRVKKLVPLEDRENPNRVFVPAADLGGGRMILARWVF